MFFPQKPKTFHNHCLETSSNARKSFVTFCPHTVLFSTKNLRSLFLDQSNETVHSFASTKHQTIRFDSFGFIAQDAIVSDKAES
jgi:hypothetical protein